MIFLSFCRGGLGYPRSNRTSESWECTTLPKLAEVMSFNPVRKPLGQDVLDDERKLHPFPIPEVPVDCYICFSTLPDSKYVNSAIVKMYKKTTSSILISAVPWSKFLIFINLGKQLINLSS